MKKTLILASIVILAVSAVVFGGAYRYGMILNPSPVVPTTEASMYDFTVKNIDGQDVKLDAYKGKVVMIVNTASRCGNTPQYEGLQALYDKYQDKGFVILGFPANNFMGQEPGTDAEIKDFCTLKYNVTFPMFSKVSVKGTDQHPFFSYLTHKDTNPGFEGDITWNFEKFLTDRNGKVIARFTPKTKPLEPQVVEAIEKALAVQK